MNLISSTLSNIEQFPFYKKIDNKVLLFVHIPKTGGTSVKHAINFPRTNRKLLINKHHLTREIQMAVGPSAWDNAFTFSFVRNPWARLYSFYLFRSRKNLRIENKINSFDEWVKFFLVVNPYKGHFRPQYDWLKDKNGEINLDFIGKFEQLEEDFQKICKLINLELELPHEENSFATKSYKLEYTEETADIVARYYKDDIDYFGYSFDDDF